MEFTVKPLETEEEIRRKAHLEWLSWREYYTGLVKKKYLTIMSHAVFETRTRNTAGNILIAVSKRKVVGYSYYRLCPDRDMIITGEITDLYILPEFRRQGIGHALLQASLEKLSMYPWIVAWVQDNNRDAAAFFSHYGFVFDGRKDMKWVGCICDESRMVLSRKKVGERHSFWQKPKPPFAP